MPTVPDFTSFRGHTRPAVVARLQAAEEGRELIPPPSPARKNTPARGFWGPRAGALATTGHPCSSDIGRATPAPAPRRSAGLPAGRPADRTARPILRLHLDGGHHRRV